MLLLIGGEEAEVEAWLGVFTKTDGPQWGGILLGVPARLARSVQRCPHQQDAPDVEAG
ncbi:hypothetical protein ACH4HG_41005 [Streptomyces coeruleorubidus]|uniref:Uncharacterized protein n=1 Tax=Streptomyces coeruleorubidus TaxID=116188 RepID=A0ABZ0K3V0_STRC4|nr:MULTISPECIES: hypothetical protein [Streptomyces]WOT32718.1 hypothetical protein R5U08_00490 [Streptomyces coeruleorubidus]GGU46412.1 hypothetical protein GCM10010244_85260 [Streptomyces bellus]